MTDYTQEQIDENRQKWLDQLRDPESKKARGMLEDSKDKNSRCCLGHACHALGIERDEDKKYSVIYYDCEDTNLPFGARNALDIDGRGSFKEPVNITSVHHNSLTSVHEDYMTAYDLIDINDETDLTPQEIADVIEDQFNTGNFYTPE